MTPPSNGFWGKDLNMADTKSRRFVYLMMGLVVGTFSIVICYTLLVGVIK